MKAGLLIAVQIFQVSETWDAWEMNFGVFPKLNEDLDLFHASSEQHDSINKCIYWPNNISIPISSRFHSEGGKTRRSFNISCEKKVHYPKQTVNVE